MKFVTISKEFFDLCGADAELLQKGDRRPHLLVLALKYKGEKYRFAVPLRSNIPPNVPRSQFFALPPRPTTKPRHRHGLHYIKMFPILPQYQERFIVSADSPYALYQSIIDKNSAKIVAECQAYLDDYTSTGRPEYAVDIDAILDKLHSADHTV